MCESYIWADGEFKTKKPANTNFRHFAERIFNAVKDQEPWFGIEQEYSVLQTQNKFCSRPLGWPDSGFPGPQGSYYCSVGSQSCYGRAIMETHYKVCLAAGVKISGTNAETMPGQWEFQVGPCLGIEVADNLWLARYLLGRVAEDYNISISYSPKLFEGFAGAGGHVNFSTKAMREGEGGMDYIYEIIRKLSLKHAECLEVYGDNSKRLTGNFETSKKDEFSYGIGNRAASVRIPTFTARDKKGYIEDRRPASDLDPYLACAMILDATLVEESQTTELLAAFREWKAWKETITIE